MFFYRDRLQSFTLLLMHAILKVWIRLSSFKYGQCKRTQPQRTNISFVGVGIDGTKMRE